ncbi:glycosyltransferase [Actinokineospora sp. NPDC004072]
MVSGGQGAPQRRALLFSFDGGTGIGHLRRLAGIARRLQGRFACLLVTSHRSAAGWLVPAECEYVHLPGWDSLLPGKAGYWGRAPFIDLDLHESTRFRKRLIAGIVAAFEPDVILVDHLPLGMHEELAEVVSGADCPKYLVTRGVQNETEDLRRLVFGGAARESIETRYRRVLVAVDQRVFDFAAHYPVPGISEKAVHTGYVVDAVPRAAIEATRAQRGLRDGDTWVVASAGSGQRGEELVQRCIDLARDHGDIAFDIVLGPKSRLRWEDGSADNTRVHEEHRDLPHLHASADLVISSGGYNSLLEALQGDARILCFPYRRDTRDEQYRHATCLRAFADIEVSLTPHELPGLFERAIRGLGSTDRRGELACDGAAAIERVLTDDLAPV